MAIRIFNLKRWELAWFVIGLAAAAIAVSCPGCASSAARIDQHGDGTAEVKQQQGAVVIDDVQRLIDAQMTGVSQRVDEVCGDLSTIKASIEANNNQIAGLAQRADTVEGDLAALKVEIKNQIDIAVSAAVAAQAGVGNQQSGRDSASGVGNSQAGRDSTTGVGNKNVGGDYIPGWIPLALMGFIAFDKIGRRWHWYRKLDDKAKGKNA